MPLEQKAPQLDTRTYDQLRRMLLERIPRYLPEWTDYNESDPGVTLLELFAFLTESLLYREGRPSERGRRQAGRLTAAALTLLTDAEPASGGVLRYVKLLRGWRARLVRLIA